MPAVEIANAFHLRFFRGKEGRSGRGLPRDSQPVIMFRNAPEKRQCSLSVTCGWFAYEAYDKCVGRNGSAKAVLRRCCETLIAKLKSARGHVT